jgi:hypothetical protein
MKQRVGKGLTRSPKGGDDKLLSFRVSSESAISDQPLTTEEWEEKFCRPTTEDQCSPAQGSDRKADEHLCNAQKWHTSPRTCVNWITAGRPI